MRLGRNMKQHPRCQLPHPAIIERRGGATLKHQPYMLNHAAARTNGWTDVLRPFPARLVRRPANRQSADVDQFKTPVSERAQLIGRFESLENDVEHATS